MAAIDWLLGDLKRMSNILYCDTETYSEVPIQNGTYKYAENAEIMLMTYAFDEGPVQCWDATTEHGHTMPTDLFNGLRNPKNIVVWHNSMFDRNVLKYSRGMDTSTSRIHDTMVIALMHGLPGGLDKLCDIFKVSSELAKDKKGKKLIHLFCKPRPKNMELRRATAKTHPEEWKQFIEYAKSDIEAMRVLYKKLPKWNMETEEFKLWQLDQKINDRGFKVDLELAQNAIEATERTKNTLANRTHQLTDGDLEATTQRDKLLMHLLTEYGVNLPDMTKSTVERRLNDPDLPDGVKELLAIRLEATTTSVSKYKRLVNGVNKDGRLRGTLQFCGAQRTGRWAGRTFQPQNLPRPTHSQDEIDQAIVDIKAGVIDLVSDDVMKLTSSAIRSCIIAEDGKQLVVSDLSNIEGRVAAWITGEDWKVKAFRDFDEGEGHDLYKLAYARSFNVAPDSVTKEQRQIGKVQELALGYGGGVGAFVTMVSAYRMDIDDMAEKAYGSIPAEIWTQAVGWWNQSVEEKRTFDLSSSTFCVADSLKRLWRNAQPNIVDSWKSIENAVRMAIEVKNAEFTDGKLKIYCEGPWLKIILPSGRALCYPSPRINEKGDITYMGMNQYSRKWDRIKTYGGKLFENVCQAVARDVMAHNMLEVEKAGFDILLTVHDELITEANLIRTTFRSEERTIHPPLGHEETLSKILATPPPWAEDLPLAASGFEADRYRKD